VEYVLDQYDAALEKILKDGFMKPNRTGVRARTIFGIMSRYRIDKGFPLLTRRKVWPKAIWAELLWFLSGSTNNKDLQALGSNIWTPWVNAEFEAKHGFGEGDLGPVYGFQLRHFGGNYPTKANKEVADKMGMTGYYGMDGFDQLKEMVRLLKEEPDSRRNLFSLWNPKDMKKMRLPPCFVAGTMVSTPGGQVPIEEIQKGDFVHTHVGVRAVSDVHVTQYSGEMVTLKVAYTYGMPCVCTPNHPFMVRGKGYTEAKDIQVGDYIAYHINGRSDVPEFSGDIYVNQHAPRTSIRLDRLEQWYMLGYFLGDGWVSEKTNRVCFAINREDKARILPMIRNVIKVSRKPGGGPNVDTYQTESAKWAPLLRSFGHKAHGKRVPGWVLDAPADLLQAFLDGYADADGCPIRNGHSHTTVSPRVALGIQQIAWKVGMKGCVYKQIRPKTTVIQGRTVSQRDTYLVNARRPAIRRHTVQKDGEGVKYIPDQGVVWLRVEGRASCLSPQATVYNLAVDSDHTYVANGLVNHNCHYTYQVYVEEDRLSGMLTQRSCDFPVGVPANIQFYSTLTIMLAQVSGLRPYEFIHSTADSHIYEDQIPAVEEYLSRPKTPSPTVEVVPANDILSYTMDNFVVREYNPQPAIKVPVAV